MGLGYAWHCTRCGYDEKSFLGTGFSYEKECKTVRKEVLRGDYGLEWKLLVYLRPDVYLDAECVLLKCEDCGAYEERPLLTAYLSTKTTRLMRSLEGLNPGPEDDHILYKPYRHRCGSCNGRMQVVSESELRIGRRGKPCPR